MSTSKGLAGTIEAQLETLSPRDRRLLVGLMLFGGVVGVGLLWYLLYGVVSDRAARVRDAKAQLTEVLELQGEYVDAAAILRAQESRLRQHAGTPVTAFVERLAGEADLSAALKSVNERGKAESVGSLTQSTWSIDLAKAPLDALVEFLYEMETSGYPIAVQKADFKATGKAGARVIDLKLDVLVYDVALESTADVPLEEDETEMEVVP